MYFDLYDTLPDDADDIILLGASPSGDAAAIMIEADEEYRIRYRGEESPGFAGLLWFGLSPDGERIAYIAVQKKKMIVAVDLKEVGKYTRVLDTVEFSSDGSRYYFEAVKQGLFGGKPVAVVDGKHRSYTNITGPFPTHFSPDGSRLVYGARKGKKRFIVIDGERGPDYEQTGSGPVFSQDSRHIAYSGQRNDTTYIVIDGEEVGAYMSVGEIAFSPDGDDYACCVKNNFDEFIVRKNWQSPPYTNVWHPTFSPDGTRLAYVAKDGDSIFAVVDSVAMNAFKDVGPIMFSPDGSRHAYMAFVLGQHLQPRQLVVVDGQPDPVFKYIYWDNANFSDDGRHFGYVGEIDTLRFVTIVDGTMSPEYSNALGPVFAPVGDGHAYRAQITEKEWCVVRDGVEGPRFSRIAAPAYSPDGQHLAYFVKKAGKTRLVVDGHMFRQGFDFVRPGKPNFSEDNQIVFFGRRGSMLVNRITVTPN
jgi:hypothetical protein